jgi:hypothetical protein
MVDLDYEVDYVLLTEDYGLIDNQNTKERILEIKKKWEKKWKEKSYVYKLEKVL